MRPWSSSLLQTSGIYVGAALLNASIPFLLMPILTRALGPEEYGIVGTFIALVNITSVLVGLSTHGIISAIYFTIPAERFGRYVSACLAIATTTTFILLITSWLCSAYIERLSSIAPSWQWTIIGAAAGQFMISVVLAVCQIRRQAIRFGFLQIANTLLNMVLTLALVFSTKLGWESRALAQSIVAIAVGMTGVAMLWKNGDVPLVIDHTALGDALRFGAALVPHGLAAALMTSIDRLVLTDLLGPAAAGQYFVAAQLAGLLIFLGNAVNQAWVPWLYRRLSSGTSAYKQQIVQVSYALFILVAAAAAILALASPLIVRIFAGEQFAEAARLLPYLAPAAAFSSAYYFVTNYLFYTKRTGRLSVITVSTAALQFALIIPFVHVFGISGAAYAALVAATTYFIAVFLTAQKFVPMPWLGARKR